MTVADARLLSGRTMVAGDLCAIGAGPAGVTPAHERAVRADVLVVGSSVLPRRRDGLFSGTVSGGAQPRRSHPSSPCRSRRPPNSRVSLGRRRDPFGLPVPCLDRRLTPLDLRSIAVATEVIDGAFRALGLGQVVRAAPCSRPPATPT